MDHNVLSLFFIGTAKLVCSIALRRFGDVASEGSFAGLI